MTTNLAPRPFLGDSLGEDHRKFQVGDRVVTGAGTAVMARNAQADATITELLGGVDPTPAPATPPAPVESPVVADHSAWVAVPVDHPKSANEQFALVDGFVDPLTDPSIPEIEFTTVFPDEQPEVQDGVDLRIEAAKIELSKLPIGDLRKLASKAGVPNAYKGGWGKAQLVEFVADPTKIPAKEV